MHTYDIRLIAMDMDGTLLNSAQEISRENLSALMEARRHGVTVAICSGRLPGDAGLYAINAGLLDCAILSLNGGYCLDRPDGTAYANHTLTGDALEMCLSVLVPMGMTFACFLQNRIVVFSGSADQHSFTWATYMEGEGAPACFYGMEALERIRADGVNKLVCLAPDAVRLEDARKRFKLIPGLEVTSSWPQNLELMPVGVNKGSAVCELATRLCLTPRQVMAIGDYDNDESMIAYAGLGVAMGNATCRIRKAAKHVTLTNDEDGVAAAIRRFVLP